tara:strand:- start:12213 stop:12515 length:303 start_codon:yes stop_codon:yes gene_type:complete
VVVQVKENKMAVPSSGEINLLGIYNEVAENNYSSGTARTNINLKDLGDGTVDSINTNNTVVNRPNTNAPHAMDEFYNYDHDKSPAPPPPGPAGPPPGGAG